MSAAVGTRITDAGLRNLSRLPALTVLSIRDTQIDDAGIEILLSIADFKRLSIRGSKITSRGVRRIKAALPKCEID